jgi:hypothetical protein
MSTELAIDDAERVKMMLQYSLVLRGMREGRETFPWDAMFKSLQIRAGVKAAAVKTATPGENTDLGRKWMSTLFLGRNDRSTARRLILSKGSLR